MNIQKMMKQAQEMQSKMAAVKARIEAQVVEGSAAGGMVKLTLNGKNEMLSVQISEDLLKPDEKETIEDLFIAAYRNAREKIDSTQEGEMASLTSGLQLPPGMKLPF